MYELAKWSFDRGVKHERNRIKRLIAEFKPNTMMDMLTHQEDKFSTPSHAQAIIDRAQEIIYRQLFKSDDDMQIFTKPNPIDRDE